MKSKLQCTCTMGTTRWLLVIICAILVHNTDFTSCAPTEINIPDNADHITGVYPTATMAPTKMKTLTRTSTTMPMPMTSAKSWSSLKPSRSKHITKSNLYKKPSKDKGGWAKVPFLSPTLVPTGYDVKEDISRHKEELLEEKTSTTTTTVATTVIDTVVDNVNGPKDYTNKNSTNISSLQQSNFLFSLDASNRAESIFSKNENGDEDSGKDIDFISNSSTTKADETYATTERYPAKAAVASSTTTMQGSGVENPVSNVKSIRMELHKDKVGKSISSPTATAAATTTTTTDTTTTAVNYTPIPTKSMPVNASLSFSSPSASIIHPPQPKLLDVGHDGVKVTKKKQLFDKHFIAATNPSASGSLHPSITKDNPWSSSLSKNKPTKGNFGGNGGKKLMEVPNGYLGPIMMKEKTFSVSHHGKKPKPSLVEQQLKDKKLVEIIAPTALMEPITKVKSSQPDFVAIDNVSTVTLATTSTSSTSTTTEGVSSSTENPLPDKAKKKEIESETATTYFLVVTQENEASSKEIASETVRTPIDPEMEPLNSGEIETTLREIYAEVINAMEGGSRGKTTSTEVVITEGELNPATTSDNLPHELSKIDHIDPSGYNPLTSLDTDHQELSENDQRQPHLTEQFKPAGIDNTESLTSNKMAEYLSPTSEGPQLASTGGFNQVNNFIGNRNPSFTSSPIKSTPSPTDAMTFSTTNLDRTATTDHAKLSPDTPLIQLQEQDIFQGNDQTFQPRVDLSEQNRASSTETPTSVHSSIQPESTDQVPSTVSEGSSVFGEISKVRPTVDIPVIKGQTNSISRTGGIVEADANQSEKLETIPNLLEVSKNQDESLFSVNSQTSTQTPMSAPKLDQFVGEKESEKLLSTTKGLNFLENHSPTTILPKETYVSKNSELGSSTQASDQIPTTMAKSSSEPTPTDHHVSRIMNLVTSTQAPVTDHITTIFSKTDNHDSSSELSVDETASTSLETLTTVNFRGSTVHDSSSLRTQNSPTSTTPLPVTSTTLNPTSHSTLNDFDKTSNPFHQNILIPTQNSEPAESKISDIQIEVYDSTIEPILAATNFKHSTDVSNPSSSHPTTKHASNKDHLQERFTQYVVDKASDFATQESSSIARTPGKPEPAAIEIHINVSEGFGNESEDLEFLYRQSDFRKFPSKKPINSLKPFDVASLNETSNEAAEEIVVEIIDGNSNSTENSASRENLNVNPVFTFRSDDDSQVELKNVKYYPEDRPNKDGPKSTDDFFIPHVGQQSSSANKPPMDRDSDTIFYISNTEVKVGESLPTTNTYDTLMKKSRLESQFFPANYEERKKVAPQRYEEDIILSPPKNGPLKVIRRPLDISYVGESIMEVEQVTLTTTTPPPVPGSTPDVIIEPAVLPEMAIGVPVIGELPPQIELKEIDYMPNFDGNKEESSIQYGGDLIDEGGALGVGFDMDSYPLGNLGMGHKNSAAISSQMIFNHRVNHLKKDVLSADLAGSSETTDGNDLLRQSNDSVNGTGIGEKMGNATAYSVTDDQRAFEDIINSLTLRTMVFIFLYTLIPVVLIILLLYIWRDYNRKYKRNPFNVMGRNSSTDPLDAEKGNGGDGDIDGVETPEELRVSSLAFGATTHSPSLEICTDSNNARNSNASNSDGRYYGNGSNSNSRAVSDTTDGGGGGSDCIQAYNPSDVQEENSTLTVHCCNIESPRPQQMISSKISPQSTATSRNAGTSAAASSTTTAAYGPNPGTMHSNYSGANGSITTMTLKNNHLIVETEERNDISRDTRVTKMHYDNSEKDGVFVVEVSRGADSKIMSGSPVSDATEKRPFNIDADVKIVQNNTDALLSNHEKVQVHPPPPPENLINHEEIDTNHLHQIDEVDEFEECSRFAKNSNTGLSQSDLSSSSSVDSNKRYSYGNQELYTIEQQDYSTPSPTATKAPHPHAESKPPQPENHNDDNGHPENGHCLEKSPAPAPKCDSSIPPPPSSDKVHDMNGHGSAVESKPKITAALLKQDTVVVNEVTNGSNHDNSNEDDIVEAKVTPHNPVIVMKNITNGPVEDIKTIADYGANTENGFDSIISLPDPPSTEEIKQMTDIILMETNQLDSLPPPPPPASADNHQHHNGNGNSNGNGIDQNGDSHSIVSTDESPIETPKKVMKPLVPPTITVADTSAPKTTDISLHTNGNCITGHATAIAVEVSGSS